MAQSRDFRLGLFILAALGGLIALLMLLGANAYFVPTLNAETYIDESVQGLAVGSPVKARGVSIGRVVEIGFVANNYQIQANPDGTAGADRLVLIRMELNRRPFGNGSNDQVRSILEGMVQRGLRARLASQGLTGQAYLEVDYQPPGRIERQPIAVTWAPRDLVIPSAPSTLSRLQETAEQVVQRFAAADPAELVLQATLLVQDLRQTNAKLNAMLDSPAVGGMANEAAATVSALHGLADSARSGLDSLLKDAGRSAERLNQITTLALDSFRQGDLAKTLHNTEALSWTLQQSAVNLPLMTQQLETTLRRIDNLVAASQRDIATTLDNLGAASGNLRDLSETAKRYPSQLLFGAPPPADKAGRSVP
jgi:phospholipid/cholesterol/gamma-HCH transport system substrate-binding protein